MIYRIDVRTTARLSGGKAAVDPVGEAVGRQIEDAGLTVGPIKTARIFLLDTPATRIEVLRAAEALLADPLVEEAELIEAGGNDQRQSRIEIHLKPGVMDPVAASTVMALADMNIEVREVRTGRAYLIEGVVPQDELRQIADRVLANGVIESVHFDRFVPDRFETGREYRFELRHAEPRGAFVSVAG
jgi:phosphoribosylformylglycinamidine (FGAM) synthase PurS component